MKVFFHDDFHQSYTADPAAEEGRWGGVLYTEDYAEIGRLVRAASRRNDGGCFAILEGGYNHNVLGDNVLALIKGLSE